MLRRCTCGLPTRHTASDPPLQPTHTCRSSGVLDAARRSGAQAIHPGYGFLSENADFARAVRDSGPVFIGPSPEAIQAMGDKAEARSRMQARGVPVVPGYHDADDDASLVAAAKRLGLPVVIKAVAGGGGKAMRIVRSEGDLPELAASARREAQHAFGNPGLFLEKFVADGRHIEFQVLADRFGHTVHLFERECSIQRRYQKIVEETPSPLLDDALRSEMGQAAVEAARAVEYSNAGTIEFIVDPVTRSYYFMEMNTRLQVEHPITEATTGIDLVQWQIRIAAGERLPWLQDAVTQRGHAIECRVYAEDPANQFLPATGPLRRVITPQGPGIRLDSGVTAGDEVTVYYDPMLAKLVVLAENREAAVRKMESALGQLIILGVATNVEFLKAIVAHPEFLAGRATTAFVTRYFDGWRPPDQAPLDLHLIAAALVNATLPTLERSSAPTKADPNSPWERNDSFRTGQMQTKLD